MVRLGDTAGVPDGLDKAGFDTGERGDNGGKEGNTVGCCVTRSSVIAMVPWTPLAEWMAA